MHVLGTDAIRTRQRRTQAIHAFAFLILAAFTSLFFVAPTCQAGPNQQFDGNVTPIIQTVVSRSNVLLADPFEIVITVTCDDSISVRFPDDSLLQLPPGLQVLDREVSLDLPAATSSVRNSASTSTENSNDGLRRSTVTLLCQAIEVGTVEFPPLDVPLFDRRSQRVVKTLTSTPISISVESLISSDDLASESPRDFATTLDGERVKDKTSLTLMIVSAVACMAVALALFLWTRGRRSEPHMDLARQIESIVSAARSNQLNANDALYQASRVLRQSLIPAIGSSAMSASVVELKKLRSDTGLRLSEESIDILQSIEESRYAGSDHHIADVSVPLLTLRDEIESQASDHRDLNRQESSDQQDNRSSLGQSTGGHQVGKP